MDDLFRLDEFDGHVSPTPPPAPRRGSTKKPWTQANLEAVSRDVKERDFMSLDELDSAPRSGGTLRELQGLVQRDADVLEKKGAAKALNALQCGWLLRDYGNEGDIVGQVRTLGPMVKEAAQATRRKLESFSSSYGGQSSRLELEKTLQLLEGEYATWELLYITMVDLRALGDRTAEQREAAQTLLYEAGRDEWVSDEDFFLLATHHNETLRRMRRVITWLEHLHVDRANAVEGVRTQHYWEHTARALVHGVKTEGDGMERLLVESLDLDAPHFSRQPDAEQAAKRLHSMDESVDDLLMKRVWAAIRAGQLGTAVAECNGCQQQWRSAILLGTAMYHDPKIVDKQDVTDVRGNSDPQMLRRSCASLAENRKLNVFERALCALVAGKLEPVLAVCQSYHDHAWAHFKVNLLHRVLGMRSPSWEEGLPPARDEEAILDDIANVPALQDIARTPYIRIQRMIILGQLNELVELLLELRTRPDCPSELIRFSSHFLLVLSKVRIPHLNPEPPLLVDPARTLVETFVDRSLQHLQRPASVMAMCTQLEEERRYECVARYVCHSVDHSATAPPVSQDSLSTSTSSAPHLSYYLSGPVVIEKERREQRRLLLLQACEASGMDLIRLLKKVVDSLLSSHSDYVLASHESLVEVLSWLTTRDDHWRESVLTANRIARIFVLGGNVSWLRHIIEAIPHATLERARAACTKHEEFALEFEYWRVLSDAFAAFSVWKNAKPINDAATTMVLYEGADEALRRVLLFPASPLFVSPVGEALREVQLSSIRRLSVTQVFSMLHYMHHDMCRYDLCMALADDVAENNLWQQFVSPTDGSTLELQRFLNLLRDSAVAALKRGHKDFLSFDTPSKSAD